MGRTISIPLYGRPPLVIGGGTRVRHGDVVGTFSSRVGRTGVVVGLHAARDVIEWIPYALQVLVEWDDGVVMRHYPMYLYVIDDK